MTLPIPPLKENDLPQREKSFWRMTGPGAIMVGMSIGSGEMILWPWITAKFGAGMVWAAALGVFLQVWINLEIGRWAIATGESAFTGFARFHKFTVFYFMAILATLALLPAWARTTGIALRMMLFGLDGPGADWMWTALIFGIVFAILFGPKRMYSSIEKVVTGLVLIIIVGMVIVAFNVGTSADVLTFVKVFGKVGQFQFDDEFSPLRLFGAFVFAGAGGFGNLFYAYYLRDKGIGMGGRIPVLANPLRGAGKSEITVGFVYRENESNHRRFKDWFRYVLIDTTFFFWIINSFVMFLFMFGALVVLHPQGIVPSQDNFIWDLSQMLETTMGTWVLETFPGVSALDFFFYNAVRNGFAMAVYVPLLLVINFKYLPKSAQPKPLNVLMVTLGAATYISFALYTLWDKIGGLLS